MFNLRVGAFFMRACAQGTQRPHESCVLEGLGQRGVQDDAGLVGLPCDFRASGTPLLCTKCILKPPPNSGSAAAHFPNSLERKPLGFAAAPPAAAAPPSAPAPGRPAGAAVRGTRGRKDTSRGQSGESWPAAPTATPARRANMFGTQPQMTCAGQGLTISGPSSLWTQPTRCQ